MSLFERISNKIKDDLIIEMNKTGDDDPWDDKDTKTENKKKANQKKKFNKKEKIESGTYNYSKDKKIKNEIGQRRTAQDRQQQIFSRQYDAYDDGDLGNPSQSKTQTTQKTPPKNRPPRKGVDYFFDAKKAKKEREAFQQGRKAYTDSRSGIKAGKVTDKGVIDYITKARNMNQGTNANTKANREAAKVIAKSSGAEYKEKIRQKYETDKDLSRKRPSNAKSLEQIKKEIDSRPPDGRTTKTKTKVKTPSYKRIETSVSDKEIQDLIKQGQKATPKKTKNITFGARDKAIKDIDDLLIGGKPGEEEFTKKALRKQQKVITKKITTPSKKEIEQSQKILDKTQTKPATKIGGKSFDDLVKDARRKNKAIAQDIAKLKTKSFVPPTTTPSVTPDPITEPLKKTRTLKKIKIKAPPKTGTFKKIMKFAGKNQNKYLKGLAYAAGGAYLLSRLGKTDNAPKNNKALGGVSGNYITKVKPVTATFTLAGKGGDGYRPAGMKK